MGGIRNFLDEIALFKARLEEEPNSTTIWIIGSNPWRLLKTL